MGLDNQLLIVPKKYSKGAFDFDEEFLYKADNLLYKKKYDLAYWRKCYGINNFFRRAFERRKQETGADVQWGETLGFLIEAKELKELAEEIKNKDSDIFSNTFMGYDKKNAKYIKDQCKRAIRKGIKAIKKRQECLYDSKLVKKWNINK